MGSETALMVACQYEKSRHIKFIHFLLWLSLEVSRKNHDNSNASNNSNDINDSNSILCHCDVDCVDNQGDSALSHVIRSSYVKAVKMLLAYYMSCNAASSYIDKFNLVSSSSEASFANTKMIFMIKMTLFQQLQRL